MSNTIFEGLLSSLKDVLKDPSTKREAIKTTFKVGGGLAAAAGGFWVWNIKRKKQNEDKEEERRKELEQAEALEKIKTEGCRDRLELKYSYESHGGNNVAQIKRETPSESITFADVNQRVGELPDAIIPKALFPGDMCTLAGENHAGKSVLMYHIGLQLAQAKPLRISEEDIVPSDKYDVFIYDRENTDATLKKRYGNVNIPNLRIIRGSDFTSITDVLDDLELQLTAIHQGKNVLVCIDNASAYKMPTSGAKITDFYVRLQSIINRIKYEADIQLTVIIAVHLSSKKESGNASSKVLGATQMISGASCNWYIKNTRFGKAYKTLSIGKNRIEDWPEQALLLRIDGQQPLGLVFERMIDESDACPLPDKVYRTIAISKNPDDEEEETLISHPAIAKEKTKEEIIVELAMAGKGKTEIHRLTGISRPTIDKYWPSDLKK